MVALGMKTSSHASHIITYCTNILRLGYCISDANLRSTSNLNAHFDVLLSSYLRRLRGGVGCIAHCGEWARLNGDFTLISRLARLKMKPKIKEAFLSNDIASE
jgi:hypothetical protein